MTIIINYGGGVNSTALLVEAIHRGIKPDLIPFADTGNEKPGTYEYLKYFNSWLQSQGLGITFCRWIRRDGTFLSIEEVCLRDSTLPSKAYGLSGCTTKWKQQPIDKLVRSHPLVQAAWARGEAIERWIGYDADEHERAARMLEKNPQPARARGISVGRVVWRAPLLEWGMGRDECLATIENAGLKLPPKSACWLCPATRKHEILSLKKHSPELLERALAVESAAAAGLVSVKGLGRSFAWRDVVEHRPTDRESVSVECGCYDGSEE